MTKALDDDAPKLFDDGQPRRRRPRPARTRWPTPRCASARASSTSGSPPCRWSRAPRWPRPTRTPGGFILYTPSQGPHAYQGDDLQLDRHREGPAAGHLDRDRRRLRRAHRVLPGADRGRRARARARQGRALHRDALGDDARDAARPRAGAGRRDRRHARRQGHRPEGARDRRLRRLSRRRGADADADRPDVVRRLRRSRRSTSTSTRSSPTRRRSAPTAARAARRRPRSSSARSTCSRPRSAWTRPRSAASNFITEFPHQTVTGANYDSGEYLAALEKCLANAGYDELRAEQTARRERGDVKQLGLGHLQLRRVDRLRLRVRHLRGRARTAR